MDEDQEHYWIYPLYDRPNDQKIDDICTLLDKWPHAKEEKCEYGVKCLKDMLPHFVKSELED